jgi:putative PIN family toxin of toxin-antitoxin system
MSRRARRGGTPLRVVFDTNVVVSALVFSHGPAARLRRCWLQGLVPPLGSRATVAELIRVLAYPRFGLSRPEQDELLGDYLPALSVVEVPDPPPRVPACRDPYDLPFLHLAAAGRADALVTGDADLLSLAAASPWRTLTPAALLDLLPDPPPVR